MKKVLFWLLGLVCLGLFAAHFRFNENRHLAAAMQTVRLQKQSEARMAAKVVESHLQRFVDVVTAMSSKEDVGTAVAAGDWQGAMDVLQRTAVNLPEIDRVTLLDLKGILRSDYPSTPTIHGRDFSFRDWYVGVTTTRRPYVSEVYKRAGLPRINVLSFAAYVLDPKTKEAVGILMLQVPASNIYGWSNGYDFGQDASVTFVDRNANIVQDPLEDTSDIAKLSDDPIVQKAQRKEVGTDLVTEADGTESLVTYAPVNVYGWSFISRQPVEVALATHTGVEQLSLSATLILLMLVLMLGFAAVMIDRWARGSRPAATVETKKPSEPPVKIA